MKQTKACGCLIGTAVIDSEKARRKNKLRIEEINRTLKNVKDEKKISKLKAEKMGLMMAHKKATSHKRHMKKRFHHYIKSSGYKPPKFKKS